MGKRVEFKLPDIGEGVAEGEVTSWKVKPGDVLKEDQVMVEVMTDKATVEIGSPVNGKVLEILVPEGQAVPVGAIIIVLEEGVVAGAAPAAAPKPAAAQQPAAPTKPAAAQQHAAPPTPAAAPAAAAKPAQAAPAPAARPAQPAPAAAQQAQAASKSAPASGKPAAVPAAHAAPKAAASGAREEINFALPDIGEGVAEGEVTKWMVKPGDTVKEDQPIVEVMTDKATVEIGSPVDGEVLQLLVKAGETVPVGAILLVLGAASGAGKHVPVPHGGHAAAAKPVPANSQLTLLDESADEGSAELVGAGVSGSAQALADTGLPSRGDGSRRVRAAPATRRFAREAGLDVAQLNGSGPDGRILMDDVRAAMAGASRPAAARAPSAAPPAGRPAAAAASAATGATAARGAAPAAPSRTDASHGTPSRTSPSRAGAPASAAAPTSAGSSAPPRAPASAAPVASSAAAQAPKPHALSGDERVPLRGLRKRIAAQMRLSKQTAAHFTYVEEIDVTELVKLRNAAKARAATAGVKLTYMPFIIKAVCVALRDFPLLNASLDEAAGELVMHHDLNIGVAVDTPNGLIVPVLRNADRKSMTDLAREMTELADRARAGKTAPADVGGGTFTITNAGNIGGLLATPIINVPEVAIMGVHAIRRRPWVVGDEIVIREIMLLSLSLDHRVVDGAVGAYCMNRIKELLENPGLMLFEPA